MILVRRFVVLCTLIFWLGGFTFYSGVVIPVGRMVLGSHRDQGFITRHVAPVITMACGVFLLAAGWDELVSRDRSVWRRRLRWTAWAILAATSIALVVLFPRLDEMLAPETWQIRTRADFRGLHLWYINISTAQWVIGMGYTWLLVQSWRNEDCG